MTGNVNQNLDECFNSIIEDAVKFKVRVREMQNRNEFPKKLFSEQWDKEFQAFRDELRLG